MILCRIPAKIITIKTLNIWCGLINDISAPTERAKMFISDCPPGENASKIDNGSYPIFIKTK